MSASPLSLFALPKEAAEAPVRYPGNSYYNELRSFGEGELWAAAINIIATAVAAGFGAPPLTLALVGPLTEKVGFFIKHLRDAFNVYNTTPPGKRDKFTYYLWKALKSGSGDLALDVAVHDPIYVVLVYMGLEAFPDTPAVLFAAASFAVALFIAAGIKVGVDEFRYLWFQRNLRNLGFGKESFIESRFHISTTDVHGAALEDLARSFGLGEIKDIEYRDKYFETNLPEFSGRKPKLRFRERTTAEGKTLRSLQIVYTRTRQETTKYSQFNFYPQRKDKFYYILPDGSGMPSAVSDIRNHDVRGYVESIVRAQLPPEKVHFERSYANHPDTLFVSADKVRCGEGFCVMEIKTYRKKDLLVAAMRQLMLNHTVLQTTNGKKDIAEMINAEAAAQKGGL